MDDSHSIFRTLTCGTKFVSKYKKDFQIFNNSKKEDDRGEDKSVPSLHFFKKNEVDETQKKGKEKKSAEKMESKENCQDSEDSPEIDNPVEIIRKQNKIKVSGFDVPSPIDSFQKLETQYQVKPYILRNLQEMKLKTPTPIQMQAVTAMLNHREVLACAPTGSGKTVAFSLPILANLKVPQRKGFRAVIVSPTRELASQIHRELSKLSRGKKWKITLLTSKKNNLSPESSKLDILITTPMRLIHMINNEKVSLTSAEWVIFDEADKLFEDQFIEQVDSILASCDLSKVKMCLFSATLPPKVEEIARTVQKDPIRILIGAKNVTTEHVDQKLMYAGSEQGKLLAIRQLIQEGKMRPPVLIFVQSKERAQELFHELVYDGINVDVIHADRTQAQRLRTVDKFRSGQIWVLITTELMARGMDFKGVNLVINYDFPQSIESYIHRVGRTGRAGRKGEAITLFTDYDTDLLRTIANVMKQSGCRDIPEWIFTAVGKPSKELKRKRQVNPVHRPSIKKVSGYDTKKRKKKNEKKEEQEELEEEKTDRSQT